MATSVRLIRRYVWLVDTIRRAGRITLDGINECWSRSTLNDMNEAEIPERTFHRHRIAAEDLFGIEILCDRNTNEYYINGIDDLSKPNFTSWLFNGLAIDNLLLQNEGVADRVIFESTADGHAYLSTLVEAMGSNRKVRFSYRSFNSDKTREVVIEPYFLKQNARRWYMIGRPEWPKSPVVYALDRIVSTPEVGEPFEYDEDLALSCDFREVIGVNMDSDYDCEKVTVRVFGHQRNYFESRILHPSQKCIAVTPEYSDYEFNVRPEYEFQHAILALGYDAEIRSPEWLRKEFQWYAEEMLKRYE